MRKCVVPVWVQNVRFGKFRQFQSVLFTGGGEITVTTHFAEHIVLRLTMPGQIDGTAGVVQTQHELQHGTCPNKSIHASALASSLTVSDFPEPAVPETEAPLPAREACVMANQQRSVSGVITRRQAAPQYH